MKNFQKLGGIGAFIMALAYIVGLGLAFTILNVPGMEDPVEVVKFHVDNYALYYAWITLIYIVAAIFLVPLALALNERIAAADPEKKALAWLATTFALIWATLVLGSGLLHNVGLLKTVEIFATDPTEAASFWRVIETVHAGIGASIEIPGGIWTLLIGIAALKSGVFPKVLNILAIVIGIAGIISIFPPLTDIVVPIYALGQIVWWIWMGIAILRRPLDG